MHPKFLILGVDRKDLSFEQCTNSLDHAQTLEIPYEHDDQNGGLHSPTLFVLSGELGACGLGVLRLDAAAGDVPRGSDAGGGGCNAGRGEIALS